MRPAPRSKAILLSALAAFTLPNFSHAASEQTAQNLSAASLLSLMEQQEHGWWDLAFADLLRAQPHLVAARNADGETPLHVAARKRYENEAFLLLRAGADVNARDKLGRTPLHLLAGQKHEDARMIRDMLVIKKADIDAPATDGFTPLMLAARAGNVSTIELLVWLGASLAAPPGTSLPSPRELALAKGHAEAAALLLPAPEGETITLQSPQRRVPAHVARAFTDAAAKKDYALLVDLLADGVEIDTRDPEQATALHRAVYRAHEEVVTFLLLLGADPTLPDRHGNTPYMAASGWFGLSMDWMRAMLLLAGSDANTPINKRGLSPLGAATAAGNDAAAQLLIWSGADPTQACGDDNITPMQVACRAGSQRLIDLLRRNGVTEPEFVDPDPQRRLEQYVKRGMDAQVRELVASGEVSLAALNERGLTLACEATHARHPDMVRLLLSLGADPLQKNRDGSTLLHATLAWDYGTINQFRAELIAEKKIDINAADNAGVTPVMRAARHGADWSGLRQLVEAGADLAARDARGRTALDLALQSGRSDATPYLLSVNAPYTDPEQVDTTP